MKQSGYKGMNSLVSKWIHIAYTRGMFLMIGALFVSNANAASVILKSIDFSTLPGDNLQVQLSLSGPPAPPRVFHTDNPARIALDLPGVGSEISKKPIPVNAAGAENIQAMEANGRTRVIISLSSVMPYESRVEGSNIFLTLGKTPLSTSPSAYKAAEQATVDSRPPVRSTPGVQAESYSAPPATGKRIENVDFRRGERGEGRVMIRLSEAKSIADVREEGRKVIVELPGVALPSTLARKLDVQDFATPVQSIESIDDGKRSRLVITPLTSDYDFSSYQSEKLLTVELRPLTKAEKEEAKKKAFTYSGQKLSLNFQDIPVRSVLQILADFTNLNIVASDTVQGNVTLRLNDVPWDQALDLVLKAKGLGKRQEGNIVRVAPLDEINKQEKEELEAQKVVEELEPLKTELFQINYTKADDIKKVLVGTSEKTNQSNTTEGITDKTTTNTMTLDVSQSILSGRGNVTVDARTNQLIIKDTAKNLDRIRDLIRQLDVPVRQVLIESRVVIASNNFNRALGARLSLNRGQLTGSTTNISAKGDDGATQSSKGGFLSNPNLLIDLAKSGAAGPGGAIGFTVLKAGEYLLDLELQAAQSEGRSETLSNPRVITSDQTKAVIMQGQEIPYQASVVAGGGVTPSVQFKQAVLELNVTPHITPDQNIFMELVVRKDEPDFSRLVNNVPPINKRQIETTVQVGNGDTVVLGGVYEGFKNNATDKVPLLGELPGIGFLFRRNLVQDQKSELLIFITPKILFQN
jgi:type IV pilus assembly protein PilQ